MTDFLKLIYHPELRKSWGSGVSKGQEDNLQEDGKRKCLVNKCVPCHKETIKQRDWIK